MSVESYKDHIEIPKDFPMKVFEVDVHELGSHHLHWHECFELNYVIKGQGVNVIGGHVFDVKQGDVYVIDNREHHYAFTDSSMKLLVLVFEKNLISALDPLSAEYIKPFIERNPMLNPGIEDQEIGNQVGPLIRSIKEELEEQNIGYQLLAKADLLKILAILYRVYHERAHIRVYLSEMAIRTNRIRESLIYMNTHYPEKITLEAVAKCCTMNPNYFSEYFRSVMKVTYSKYLMSLRVKHSLIKLTNTDLPITTIAMDCGYSSVSYFNRAFKKVMEISPSDYRKIHRQSINKD